MILTKILRLVTRQTVLCVVGIIWLLFACSSSTTLDELKKNISNELSRVDGDFAVAFRDLQTGETLLINEHEVFHAASTMKTPVMIEVFKQVAAGNLSLEDSVTIVNEFKSIVDSTLYSLTPESDSEQELYTKVGTRKRLGDLVYDMIIVSSNLATNIIIELVDARKVTQSMRDMGANDIMVLRGVEDQKAYEAGLSNTTTALDLMIIFEKLAKGEAVNPLYDQQMIDILSDQHFNEIIPAKLPESVEVAHKTGSITGVQHDSGIVFNHDGTKYVLVLLSKNLSDPDKGVKAMAAVSEMIYHYMVK